MFAFLRARWQQRVTPAALSPHDNGLPPRFRGRPVLAATPADGEGRSLSAPVDAPSGDSGRSLPIIDLGRSVFAPEEVDSLAPGVMTFTRDYRMATNSRAALLVSTREMQLARALDHGMRRLLGRSLRLRQVAAGSCGGCEGELVALSNVVFDMARFGIQFVASPRHADGIVITGAISATMLEALEKTYEAVPDPRIVIAVGACAISGGVFAESPQVLAGVPASIPVDLWIPGCPPHPLTVLDGLLRLLGRLEDSGNDGG